MYINLKITIILILLSISTDRLFARSNSTQILITANDQTVTLKELETLGLVKKLTSIKRLDPSSTSKHLYEGYYLKDVILFVKKRFLIKNIAEIETVAKDGYKVLIHRKNFKSPNTFMAINIKNVPKKGLYNKSLKKHFDWRPSYILFDKKDTNVTVSSPYQVTKLIFRKKAKPLKYMLGLSEQLKPGAKVFQKTCSKCHSFQGYGGHKAPKLKLVLKRWRNKSELELLSFLRDPQGYKKRKIQMSPFKGSSQEAKELLKFLKSLK